MIKFILSILDIIFKLTPTTYDVVIVEASYPSGSNTKLIYEKLSQYSQYKIDYIDIRKKDASKINLLKTYINNLYRISRAKIVVSSHGSKKTKKSQILINLWHGIPLKSMNYMESKLNDYTKFNDDILITNSKIESVLLSSCMFIPASKHILLGSPRLDLLTKDKIVRNEYTESLKKFKNVVIYLPTFRGGFKGRREGIFNGNLFNMKSFDPESFNNFLAKENILLIAKYHPYEVNELDYNYDSFSNIQMLTDDFLKDKEMDLYELLSATDMLITDYSSVYFDYLLLNKPIIFTPTDLEEYTKDRGILLEPYNCWTPGPKVVTQSQIEMEIINQFEHDQFLSQRHELKNKMFSSEVLNSSNTNNICKYIIEKL